MDTLDWIAACREELYALREELHRCPELSHQEYHTSALIEERLRAWGIPVLDFHLKTGVVAKISGGRPGKLLALREDIDALPIQENTGLPFSSKSAGVSHACGHDIHTAALLGAARLLSEHRERLSGDVLLIFQCAEESFDGAASMLEYNIFRDQTPEAVVGFHCSPQLPLGKIGILEGVSNASCDSVTLTVTGKGGHGAHPEDCIDPVVMSAGLLMQLQTIVSRRSKATDPVVLTFGEIHGGSASNIIPSQVVLRGTMRTFDNQVRIAHLETLRNLCHSFCQSLGGECDVKIEKSLPPLINSPDICRQLRSSAQSVLGAGCLSGRAAPSMGSDDFSCILEACGSHGAQYLVGTGLDGNPATRMGLHVAENIFPSEALDPAVATLVQFTLDYLK